MPSAAWKSETSLRLATALPPPRLISSTTWCAGVESGLLPSSATPRSATTTLAPSRASKRATPDPMPRPEPVTTATRPSSLPMLVSFSLLNPLWPPPATPPGWVRLDCHLHTAASGDARTTLDELAERDEAVQLDVVCITDHHSIEAAQAALGRNLGVRVIVGEEIRTSSGEIIGLYLTERIPYVLPLAEVVRRIRAQGGLVYAT